MILFVIGVGSAVVFLLLSDNQLFQTLDEDSYILYEKQYDKDRFDEIELDFLNRDYEVYASADDQIHIEYYLTDKDHVKIEEEEDSLEIENSIRWFEQIFSGWNWNISRSYFVVKLYLPANESYDVSLETANGDIQIMDVSVLSELEIKTANGNIICDQVDAINVDVKTSNGEIRFTDVSVLNEMKVRTSNGKIKLNDVSAQSIDGATSNGDITAEQIETESIELDSSNGDVILSIYGDKEAFEVTLDSSNGDLFYDGIEVAQEHFNPDGVYTISLDSSNGDVSVTFIQ